MTEILRLARGLETGWRRPRRRGKGFGMGRRGRRRPGPGMERRCLHRTSLFPPVGGGRSLSEVRGGTISHHAAVFRRGGNLLPLHRQGSQRTERWEALSPEPRK